MAFNSKLELAGVWLLLIFSANTVVQTILAAKYSWWEGTAKTWIQFGAIWGLVFSAILTLAASAILVEIFMTRTRIARIRNANLDFGNQETRKNSVKKMIIASIVFIQIALLLFIPEIITYIQTLFRRPSALENTSTHAIAEYISFVFTCIASGLSVSVLTETSRIKHYLSK